MSKSVYLFLFLFSFIFLCLLFCVGEDRDVIFITLLPLQYSRTVTVIKGPQTTNRVCITENPPSGPSALICLSQQLLTHPNTSLINASPTRVTPSLHNECSTWSSDTKGTSVPVLSSLAADVLSISLNALDLGSHINTLENTPSLLNLHYHLPSHLRGHPLHDWFHVSKEVLKQYPPFYVGWKKPSWVVVICRQDIGIFHNFWYVFWVL